MVSTKPSAVRGLTKADAPCSAVTSSGRAMQPAAPSRRYSANMPPPIIATRLPSNAWASGARSEEHTSELQSLMRISYAVFCLKKKKKKILDNSQENEQDTNVKK